MGGISADNDIEISGATDGTNIGNTGDRLKVDAQIDPGNVSLNPPSFSTKFRAEILTTPIAITSTVTYTTVYSYSGSGLLVGFNLEFSGEEMIIKLTVDSEVIFESLSLKVFKSWYSTANSIDRRQAGMGLVLAGGGDRYIDFSLRSPIRYESSILIEVKLSGGGTKNFNQGIVYLTKET